MPQQARPKHSEVLDAKNLKRIDNRNLQRQTFLLSELLAKNKRKNNNNNNFQRKKNMENPDIDPRSSDMLSERSIPFELIPRRRSKFVKIRFMFLFFTSVLRLCRDFKSWLLLMAGIHYKNGLTV